ncbi:unnamed protein product, partial [Owenia fusiformis]
MVNVQARLIVLFSFCGIILIIYTNIKHNGYKGSNKDDFKLQPQMMISGGRIKPEKQDQMAKKLPGVINIGVSKCGTGALQTYMKIHPNIVTYPHLEAETHFFDKKINQRLPFEQEIQRYKNMMPEAFPNETVYEKTPSYFDVEVVDPYDLYRMNPAVKLILLVCDPVRRTMSAYLNQVYLRGLDKPYEYYTLDEDGNVNAEAENIHKGRYDKPLLEYLKYFPQNKIHILE